MTKNTHLVGGILFTVATISSPIGICAGLVGSVLPDIDHEESYLGRKVKFISRRLDHRCFCHSLFFVAIITLIGDLFSKEIAMGLCLGMLSHLVLDMFNKRGVPLFMTKDKKENEEYNFKHHNKKNLKYYKFLKGGIPTRGWEEFWFRGALIILSAGVITFKIVSQI